MMKENRIRISALIAGGATLLSVSTRASGAVAAIVIVLGLGTILAGISSLLSLLPEENPSSKGDGD